MKKKMNPFLGCTRISFLVWLFVFKSVSALADLQPTKLKVELLVRDSVVNTFQVHICKVTFTNLDDKSQSVLMPGTQNFGERILRLHWLEVTGDSKREVYADDIAFLLDTSYYIGSAYIVELEPGKSIEFPILLNDFQNAQRHLESSYRVPPLNEGFYELYFSYEPFRNSYARWAYNKVDEEGNLMDSIINPDWIHLPASGLTSNLVRLFVTNKVVPSHENHTTCMSNCRLCRSLRNEHWNATKRIIRRKRWDHFIAPHQQVMFNFYNSGIVQSSLPTFLSRQALVKSRNGYRYLTFTWQIGKIKPVSSRLNQCWYICFRATGPFRGEKVNWCRLNSCKTW
jgi:hypothetical protein